MTYCVGLLLEAGLIMLADTRTNAGIDNISVFKKLHVIANDKDRLVVAASAGSLSVTQSMLSSLEEGLPPTQDGGNRRFVMDQPSLFHTAGLVGEALSNARRTIGTTLQGTSINAGASVLLGGRVGNEPLSLYLIYAEGNFIECQPDAPFLQIGELKYGKPILDRALTWATPLDEALKVALISFDGTIRSNLSVGRPIDLIVVPSDPAKPVVQRRIGEDDAYFNMLSSEWGRLLNEARDRIADPPYLN